jgi:hypothetical protein
MFQTDVLYIAWFVVPSPTITQATDYKQGGIAPLVTA